MITGRKISQIIHPTASGPLYRLIGTTDIDGSGTPHPLPDCDPFMLLDQGVVPKSDLPPFGVHPHRGHSVVTILRQGKMKSWDSFSHKWSVIESPASYWVDAGSGVFHEERTIVDDPTDEGQHCSIFQLWVSVSEEDRSKAPRCQYDSNLPVVDAFSAVDGEEGVVVGSIRYYVGGGGRIETIHPIVVAHVTQNCGTTLEFPIDPTFGGCAIHVEGSVFYGEEAKEAATLRNAVHVLADASGESETFLKITTAAAESCKGGEKANSYFICVGEKIAEPWYKKLVANGAIIAKSEDEAREIASRVEEYSKVGKCSGNFEPFGAVVSGDS